MGEYAKNTRGERVKIGTCENMYYLRYDQRERVTWESGNVNPVKDAARLRFRFPWPDEDGIEPGEFDGAFDRGLHIPGLTAPHDIEHGNIQFSAPAGYLVSLPCPEGPGMPGDIKVHRNGFVGAVHLAQQRFVPGIGLVPILRCTCGTKYRLTERYEIEALAVACRTEGDSLDHQARISREFHERKEGHAINWAPMPGVFWHAIADRILDGIAEGVGAR